MKGVTLGDAALLVCIALIAAFAVTIGFPLIWLESWWRDAH